MNICDDGMYLQLSVFSTEQDLKNVMSQGGSSGLVVMGGDSFSKGHGLNPGTVSWMDIFSHLFVVKIVMCVWKDENKWKRGRGWPIFKWNVMSLLRNIL